MKRFLRTFLRAECAVYTLLRIHHWLSARRGSRLFLLFLRVSVYNEYYMSNLYLQTKELRTISTALYAFTGPYGNQYNYICAGVLITIIPIFILFLIFQKQVYGGMAAGAVKG